MQALNQGRWPVLAKMHGDFQSLRLKNTSDELRNQDEKIRHAMLEDLLKKWADCCRIQRPGR